MENEEREKVVIAGLNAAALPERERSTPESMEELAALVSTAGGECMARLMQTRDAPDPRTFFGEGKTGELRALAETNGCTLCVFDNELSPAQTNALADELGIRVMDRNALILDIFAERASTREGRLQVELAQYNYLLPRLTGMWKHLVRQTASGGSSPIGTRGPGETQLETDRRHIRRRIDKLEEELESVRRVRSTQRRRREKNHIPVAALVGYTNAGKSTLLNALTGAGIPANDRLFDTLDTTTRRLRIGPSEILVSDTVGFIRKLPHTLVEAFKATLEELTYADLILHVIDASSPEWREQMAVAEDLIAELGASETPRIEVFNKSDRFTGEIIPETAHSVRVSALTGEGLDRLLTLMEKSLSRDRRRVILEVPYQDAGVTKLLHERGEILRTEYLDDCIELEAVIGQELFGQVRQYVREPELLPEEGR